MSADVVFTKEYLDRCLKELGKEFRRLNGKTMPAEIVLIGGAAVLANYGFRDMTYDVDALIQASSVMKEAIQHVGDSMNLPNGWLNADFIHTKSYSPRLAQYSVYYKTFANILEVRTMSAEYLIAMKLMSGRQYKNDISDIIGILWEQKQRGKPITFDDIEQAVYHLYDGWERMPKESVQFIRQILENDQLDKLYQAWRDKEKETREALVDLINDYPEVEIKDNMSDVLAKLKARKKKGEPNGNTSAL